MEPNPRHELSSALGAQLATESSRQLRNPLLSKFRRAVSAPEPTSSIDYPRARYSSTNRANARPSECRRFFGDPDPDQAVSLRPNQTVTANHCVYVAHKWPAIGTKGAASRDPVIAVTVTPIAITRTETSPSGEPPWGPKFVSGTLAPAKAGRTERKCRSDEFVWHDQNCSSTPGESPCTPAALRL
jgi:hypothetical protein